MRKQILIEADYNDGDYDQKRTDITDEQIEFIKPVIAAIKAQTEKMEREKDWPRHNWETYYFAKRPPEEMYIEPGILTEEQVNFFNQFVPDGDIEYEPGVHTIKRIIVYEIGNEVTLF